MYEASIDTDVVIHLYLCDKQDLFLKFLISCTCMNIYTRRN